jgi:hypothetical protein
MTVRVVREFAQLVRRAADLFQRLLDRHFPGQTVGRTFTRSRPRPARVMYFFGGLNVLRNFCWSGV